MTGLYIHVPFCVKKCAYCDFYSMTDTGLISDYVDALKYETGLYPDEGVIDTVYFGGGTPSLLNPEQVGEILGRIRLHYSITPDAEITLEVNPGTVTFERLTGYRNAGINRLSIGIQSFQDHHLTFLGRIHTSDEARQAVKLAGNTGFTNISLDLIYGLPGQDEDNWLMDLTEALTYQSAHLSCYALSIEEGTPLFKALEKKEFQPADDETAARLFTRTMEYLEEQGFVHYEVSNYARNEALISRHNMKYWNFEPYRGFGPSAHSYVPSEKKRYWNVRDAATYIRRLKRGASPVDGHEILDPSQQLTEAVFLGLRKGEGISIPWMDSAFGMDALKTFGSCLRKLTAQGLVHVTSDRIRLTRKGFLFADRIAAMLIDEIDL